MRLPKFCGLISLMITIGGGMELSGQVSLDGLWMIRSDNGRLRGEEITSLGYDVRGWLPARVPGIVQTALLENGKIPDPYYGTNNEEIQWVIKTGWWYRREFAPSPKFPPPGGEDKGEGKAWLILEGINYEAEIWLNTHRVGGTIGMFKKGIFDVTNIVNLDKTNYLAVKILPPPEERTRAVACQISYWWDFAPKIIPVGIWKSVNLKLTGPIILENPYIISKLDSPELANLEISVAIKNTAEKSVRGQLKGNLEGIVFSRDIELGRGERKIEIFKLDLPHPRLWWPNGMGEQNLYKIKLQVLSDGRISDETSTRIGIREVELLSNEGEFDKYNWTFCINGRKVFAKGANWVPVDSLFRLTPERYRHLLGLFRDAGLNMLRVHGGGIAETETFYDLCNEYGILIWQEFWLACIDYPGLDREVFLANAEDMILHLRNHPSLVYWCGGNEFNPDNRRNKDLIDGLEELCQEFDSPRIFHRASPYEPGIKNVYLGGKGEDHNWLVWHQGKPYTAYRQLTAFRAEAGLQAPPVVKSLKKFIPEDELFPPGGCWKYHHLEKKKMDKYVAEYGDYLTADEYVKKAQLCQAINNQYNLEFCRSRKYQTSGCLIWQYSEPWPGINWSIVDWYGEPKAAYYFYKRAAEPLHIQSDYETYNWGPGETFTCPIYVVNDFPEVFDNLTAVAKIYTQDGKKQFSKTQLVNIPPDKAREIFTINWTVPEEISDEVFFLRLELVDANTTLVSRNFYWFAASGALRGSIYAGLDYLPPVNLETSASWGEGLAEVAIKNPTPNIAFFVWIESATENTETTEVEYNDNYFFLLPEESKKLTVRAKEKPGLFIKGWNVVEKKIIIE